MRKATLLLECLRFALGLCIGIAIFVEWTQRYECQFETFARPVVGQLLLHDFCGPVLPQRRLIDG